MSMRHQFAFTASYVDQFEVHIRHRVEVKSPDKEQLAKELTGVSLTISPLQSKKGKACGPCAHAGMTVQKAETLAMRILEACAAARISAKEIGYRRLK